MSAERSRRDFLRGVSAADRVLSREVDTSGAAASGRTKRFTRRAMACQFEICLNEGQYPDADEIALAALDLVDELESQLSLFRPTSEISKLNVLAAARWVEVEPRLFDLLQLARRVSRETDGAFDITATPLWELWGFSRQEGDKPTQQQIDAARQCVGMHLVELDSDRRAVRFLREGVRLNLGAIGKGYALDRCAEMLLGAGVTDFLLSGGYSSMIARGGPLPEMKASQPPSAQRQLSAWRIGIRNPLRPDRRMGEVLLTDRALATSGSYIQSFRIQGKDYGHIIDPRTGWPAANMLSTTAVAPTAATADALSTAFYVMGVDLATAYCTSHPEIGAVLQVRSRRHGGMLSHALGLIANELHLD